MKYWALMLFVLSSFAWANNPEWINYTSGGRYMSVLASEGNFLWAKTEDRVFKIDKTTGEVVYYDRGNSGLPSNAIRAFAIDRNGNKWIGTSVDSVIVKFDGVNWTVIPVPNFGLTPHTINAFAFDNNNNLWIGGTGTGLTKFDGVNWTNYNSANSGLPSYSIYSLASDTKGTLWIGTSAGLVKYDGDHWTTYDTLNSKIPGNRVWDVRVDDNDHIWIGAWGPGYISLPPAKFDGEQWTIYGASDSLYSQVSVGSRGVERKGTLWFMTSQGIQTYEGTHRTTYDISNSGLPNNDVTSIVFDENDAAWIGTWGCGVVRFDGHEWKKYNTLNSGMPAGVIRTVVVDRLDNYWVGSDNGQIVKFDGKNWTSIDTIRSGILGDKITSLAVDSVGNVFVGTLKKGLKKYDGSQWRDLGERINNVSAIAIDPSGAVWVGMETGIRKLIGETWTFYGYQTPGFPQYSNSVYSIAFAPNGDVWAGTSSNPAKFNGAVWTTYTGLQVGSMAKIAVQQNGTVWLGGFGSTAVGRFDGSNWIYYAPQFYSYASSVSAVAIDIDGNKWVGSDHGGVARFNEFSWTYFNSSNSGLESDDIYSIAVDSKGNKLFATGGGLSVYKKGGVVMDAPVSRDDRLPRALTLSQNFPNPFNPSTTITFSIPLKSRVSLKIFDAIGREVSTLVSEDLTAGTYSRQWNASGCPSGVYFYRLQAGSYSETKRLILLR